MTKEANIDTVNKVNLELEDEKPKKKKASSKKNDVLNMEIEKAKKVLEGVEYKTDTAVISAFSMSLIQVKIDRLVKEMLANQDKKKHNLIEKIENMQLLECYLDAVISKKIKPLHTITSNILMKTTQGKGINALGIKAFSKDETSLVLRCLENKIKEHNKIYEMYNYNLL